MIKFLAILIILAATESALACPDGQSKGTFGWCYPNVGGDVGKAWEKGKKELDNFKDDALTWIKTGKCGGDICDAFSSAVQFGKDEVTDFGISIKNASDRLQEGKPLDAIWHLQTDFFKNSQENAADAAKRSRVLLATGQVAASVYGGPQGAAAYTAWLTYNTTGSLNDALKAGIIAGVSSAALGRVSEINLADTAGIVAKSILTGAVNGVAVAASGGSDAEIRTAMGMGIATIMIREGYKKLTSFELNENRLRSSTGEAYCLAEDPRSGLPCLPPQDAYKFNPDDGSMIYKNGHPDIDFTKLDPDRPHVGIWAKADTSKFNVTAENSKIMTGVSRLPGWNAMAVAHDVLSDKMNFDLLPGGLGIVPTIATIPPALVVTYMGSGYQLQDTIRNIFVKNPHPDKSNNISLADKNRINISQTLFKKSSDSNVAFSITDTKPTETLHLFCGIEGKEPGQLSNRTDVLVRVAADGRTRGSKKNICEIKQLSKGVWYELGHAHYQINYCHKVAERIAKKRQEQGSSCFASTGLVMAEVQEK